MSVERANAVHASALARAGLVETPEDLVAFQAFVQGALTSTLAAMCGADATDACIERLSHVLWMASSTVRGVVPTPRRLASSFDPAAGSGPRVRGDRSAPASARAADERDGEAPSGMREVEAPGASSNANRPTLPAPPAPGVPPASASAQSSGRHAIGRLSVPRVPAVLETRAERQPVRGAVLVVSLDTELTPEVERAVGDRRPVVHVRSQADLVRAISSLRATGFTVLVDSMLPSVELPTFVGMCSLLPPATRVLLWAADARQKKRLATSYPIANEWIVCGETTTLVELLIDRED